MSSAAISSTISYTSTKSNLSTPKSSLQLSSQSHISINSSNFSESLRKSHFHSKLAAPISAFSSNAVYIDTESYYDLLGISETDSIKEIKTAYKLLARKYHPDVSPAGKTEECTKKFIQVQEAYETLSDPKSRASYDRDLARGLGLHANFSARSGRYEPGKSNMNDWEQRWQCQLAELIRRSNSKEFERSSWGDRMGRQRSCSN